MTTNYRQFMAALVKWPINAHRKNRDYAFHLRTLLLQYKVNENFFPGKPADTQKKIASLVRLGDNRYGLKYPCIHKQGASGLEQEDVAIVLSDEFIEYFNNNQGFLKHFLK